MKYKNLKFSKYVITQLARTVKNIKASNQGNLGNIQGTLEISTDLNSLCSKLCTVKSWSTLPHEKCTLLKQTQKSFNANILIWIHFKNKAKSGIPFSPLFTVPVSFNNICPTKWFTALTLVWMAGGVCESRNFEQN